MDFGPTHECELNTIVNCQDTYKLLWHSLSLSETWWYTIFDSDQWENYDDMHNSVGDLLQLAWYCWYSRIKTIHVCATLRSMTVGRDSTWITGNLKPLDQFHTFGSNQSENYDDIHVMTGDLLQLVYYLLVHSAGEIRVTLVSSSPSPNGSKIGILAAAHSDSGREGHVSSK